MCLALLAVLRSKRGLQRELQPLRAARVKSERTKNQFDLEALEPRLLLSGEVFFAPPLRPLLQEESFRLQLPLPRRKFASGRNGLIAVDPAETVDDIFDGMAEDQEVVAQKVPPCCQLRKPTRMTRPSHDSVTGDQENEVNASADQPRKLLPECSDDSERFKRSTCLRTSGSNPTTQQLTDTLKAANGPPDGAIQQHSPDS